MLETALKLLLTKGVPKLWEHKGMIMLYLKTYFGKYRKKKIRFSMSYLFRIKIPQTNAYLLVYNRRIENQLQPVGGVYQRYGDDKLFESWGYEPDNNRNGIGTDSVSSSDLRFRVLGKNVVKVIRWFEEGKEREISAHREFTEELIDTGILEKELFNKIKYRHIGRISKNLKWSEHHSCFEVMIYDIMEFLPDDKQQKSLIELYENKDHLNNNYLIVESEDIEQLRVISDKKQIARIGAHTKFIINQF